MTNLSDADKEYARKLLEEYFEAFDKGRACTFLVTTDGQRRRMITSSHPLPGKYLEQWGEDCKQFNVVMSLDE